MSIKPKRRSQHHRGGGVDHDGEDLNIPLDSTSVIRRLVHSDQDSRRLDLRRVDTFSAAAGDVSTSSSIESEDLMFENDGSDGYIDGTKINGSFSGGGNRQRYGRSGGGRMPYIPQSIEEYRAHDNNPEDSSMESRVSLLLNEDGANVGSGGHRARIKKNDRATPIEEPSFCSMMEGWCI